MSLRSEAIEAMAEVIFHERWPKMVWAEGTTRRHIYLGDAEVALDALLDYLTAEWADLSWPRDQELPADPEEWPLIPKLELLASYADATDDKRGATDPSQRTVQKDVRRAIAVLESIAGLRVEEGDTCLPSGRRFSK